MQCPKCNKIVPDDAVFCCFCGKRLIMRERKAKKRPNGTGCIYKLGGNRVKPWGIKKNEIFLGSYPTKALAIAFLPNPNHYPEVNHKDENKLNNSIENLEWCDKKYNRNYGTRNIRAANSRSKNVTCLSKDLTNVKTYRNIIDASNDTGICRQELYTICQGKKAATGEFYWWYTDEFIILLLKLCTSKTKKAIFHSPVVEFLSYQQLYELMLRLINQDDGDLMCPVKK